MCKTSSSSDIASGSGSGSGSDNQFYFLYDNPVFKFDTFRSQLKGNKYDKIDRDMSRNASDSETSDDDCIKNIRSETETETEISEDNDDVFRLKILDIPSNTISPTTTTNTNNNIYDDIDTELEERYDKEEEWVIA